MKLDPKPAARAAQNRPEALVRLPLSAIHFRFGWNARSESAVRENVARDGEEVGYNAERDGTGLGGSEAAEPGLIGMLLAQGQLQPIDARPVKSFPQPDEGNHLCEAVDGHRRGVALQVLAEAALESEKRLKEGKHPHGIFASFQPEWGRVEWAKFDWHHPIEADPEFDAREPSAKVLLREMTELEARERNLGAGTSSARLSAPDLAFGVDALKKAALAEGRRLSLKDLATRAGKSSPYVGCLLKIMECLPKEVTEHWRRGGPATIAGERIIALAPLGVDILYTIANLDEDLPGKARAYAGAVMTTQSQRDGTRGYGKNAFRDGMRLAGAKKSATRIGLILAWAKGMGVSPDMSEEKWQQAASELVRWRKGKGVRKPTAEEHAEIASVLRETFEAEVRKIEETGRASRPKPRSPLL